MIDEKVLGKLKNELPVNASKIMFCAFAPKVYYFRYQVDGIEKRKIAYKGIRTCKWDIAEIDRVFN